MPNRMTGMSQDMIFFSASLFFVSIVFFDRSFFTAGYWQILVTFVASIGIMLSVSMGQNNGWQMLLVPIIFPIIRAFLGEFSVVDHEHHIENEWYFLYLGLAVIIIFARESQAKHARDIAESNTSFEPVSMSHNSFGWLVSSSFVAVILIFLAARTLLAGQDLDFWGIELFPALFSGIALTAFLSWIRVKDEGYSSKRGKKASLASLGPASGRNFHPAFLVLLLPVAVLAGLLVPVLIASVIPGESGKIVDAVKPDWVGTVHLGVLIIAALSGAAWLGTSAFHLYRNKGRALNTFKKWMPWAVGPALCWILALNLGIGGLVESERSATNDAWSDVRNQAIMITDQNQCESPQDVNACNNASTRLKALGADYEEISSIRWCKSCRAPTSYYFTSQAETLEATAALLANADEAGARRLRVTRECDGNSAQAQEIFSDQVCMINVYADLFYSSSTRGFVYEVSLNAAGRRACPSGLQLNDDLSDEYQTLWENVSDLGEVARQAYYIRAQLPSELLGLREASVSSFAERGIWLTTEDWRATPIFTLPVSRTSTGCRLNESHFNFQTIAVP